VCATTANAAAGQLIGSMRTSLGNEAPAFVHGLVPDGVTGVTLTGPDGTTATAPVTENVYATTIAATPATVTYTSSDGQVTVLDVP
jgi:hypothetical protein